MFYSNVLLVFSLITLALSLQDDDFDNPLSQAFIDEINKQATTWRVWFGLNFTLKLYVFFFNGFFFLNFRPAQISIRRCRNHFSVP